MARYRIVPEQSHLWAEARSSLHPILMETDGLEGYFEVEPSGNRLNLDAPVTGRVEIDAELLKTGNILYDREIERRLEVRKYPRIRGEVQGISTLDSGGRYRVRGELSLRGVTRAVEGDVTVRVVDESTLEVEGEQVFDIRDFGLEPPKILMLRVYPEIKVRGHVVAQRVQ